MSDLPVGRVSALLPAVLVASSLSVAVPDAALAYGAAAIDTVGDLPAVMQKLPVGFRVPERLAAYEQDQAEGTEVAMRMLDWLFGGPVNRCGTTSGCASGWDDSDCF